MRTALVTTTINVPAVLAIYRRLDPNAMFFVTGDLKTPNGVIDFCALLPDCRYLSPAQQQALSYKSSELIGWNTDSRRNIALLEALKWGADLIVTIDDDVIPVSAAAPGFGFARLFAQDWYGLQLGKPACWFDAGAFTVPPARQRGLPLDVFFDARPSSTIDARIGAVQGVILGVPDTDAPTAIAAKPAVHSATDILRGGFVVERQAYTVLNSQFTAFRRELAPAAMQHYAEHGRNTDILASLLMRRLMLDRGLYTFFGGPVSYHARRPRPVFPDLKAEMFGIEHAAEFASYLDNVSIAGQSTVDACRTLVEGCALYTERAKEAALAFFDDCESVL